MRLYVLLSKLVACMFVVAAYQAVPCALCDLVLQNNEESLILFCCIKENMRRDKMQSHPASKITFQLEQALKSSSVFPRHMNLQSQAGH